ncbi:hypothetical protein ABIB83_002509 [Bradyrhizobium sp. I1.8.5]|uniref:hypothetical protein n=1 Tax=Bradyrhizobium sp. I1.8.5 TaxID=3156365 RepID=UPI00339777B1
MNTSIYRQRVLSVALSFHGKFTTEEFINCFKVRFPKTWARLVRAYGSPSEHAGR